MRSITVIIWFSAFITCHTLAQNSRHGAHLHGVAELTVAAEEGVIEMMFTAPAESVVGFESKAVTLDQLKVVEDARLVLRDPSRLVTFVGKQCHLIEVAVDFTAISESHTGNHADSYRHDEDHSNEEGSAAGNESHTDISAKYEFECSSDGELKKLQFGPDGLLFGLDKVNVMWVSESGQGAAEVTSEQLVVELN